jgi:hypothetical protein
MSIAAAASSLVIIGCGAASGTRPAHKSVIPATPSIPATPVETGLPGDPGVVTLARLPAPAGIPKTATLTSQIFELHRKRYVALRASQVTSTKVGSSTGPGVGPLPLANRPLVAIATAGWCTPAPVELVWGLAARGTAVLLTTPGATITAHRSRSATTFDARASLYYAFARSAPVHVVVRSATGATVANQLVNAQLQPYGCNAKRLGVGPTASPPYSP